MKKPIKIFLVDDHPLIIDGIKMRLADVPQIKIIAEANNGKEALEKLKKYHPDVILMDIVMPVMNGFDTVCAILADYPAIKIIALTTYDEKAIIKKMLSAGAHGYILKNVKKEELIQAIDTVIKGEHYFCSEISLGLAKSTAVEIFQNAHPATATALTPREKEILRHIAMGFTNNEIGKKLFISPNTVDTHRTNIMEKLNMHNVASLIHYAIQNGYIS